MWDELIWRESSGRKVKQNRMKVESFYTNRNQSKNEKQNDSKRERKRRRDLEFSIPHKSPVWLWNTKYPWIAFVGPTKGKCFLMGRVKDNHKASSTQGYLHWKGTFQHFATHQLLPLPHWSVNHHSLGETRGICIDFMLVPNLKGADSPQWGLLRKGCVCVGWGCVWGCVLPECHDWTRLSSWTVAPILVWTCMYSSSSSLIDSSFTK